MKQRAITAVFFAATMLGGVYGGKYPFFLLFLLLTAGCTWELLGLLMVEETRHKNLRRLLGVLLCSTAFFFYAGQKLDLTHSNDMIDLLPTFAAMLFCGLALFELFLGGRAPFANVGYYLIALFYIALPFYLLTEIATQMGLMSYAPHRVFGLLLLVWTNDTMAYVMGSKIGKTKLFERISPKKTWEGTVSGGICTMMIAYVLSLFIPDFSSVAWVGLAAVAAIFGTLGDLVESMLKRSLGVKDSGNLLPGHGGLLDRFDAFLFALPFYWFLLRLL
jgi:phosphatidate cytidylyltransferase